MTQPRPPIAISPGEWELVRALLASQLPDRTIWAFGSRARGTARPYSDLDLAIVSPTPLPLGRSAAVKEAFSDSDLPWPVDLVEWAHASPAFRAVIERDRVILQEAAPESGAGGGE